MSASRLRPLLLRLTRHLHNHEYGKFQPACLSHARPTLGHRPCFRLVIRTTSSIAQSPEKAVATDISSVEKTEDSQTTPTTPGEDEAAEVTEKKRVVILWDLDNKQPIALPEHVALAIRSLAAKRGEIVEYSAMANFHTFMGLPPAAKELKRKRQELLSAERRGEYKPPEPYRCPMCGKRCATQKKLQRHYKLLHERERAKKLAKLSSLKGKKRKKWLALRGAELKKRSDAHYAIKSPQSEHKVFRSLKRAGVLVRMVSRVSQAADVALHKRFAQVKKGSDLILILISDDYGFRNMVERARKKHGVYSIIIGESPDSRLAKVPDEWLSWNTINETAFEQTDSLLREVGLPPAKDDDDDGPDYVVDDDVAEEIMAHELGDEEIWETDEYIK
ncbi:hypothetical protein F4805DRAFT_171229 [Annulohypoxylon moriforme]|nr:hypothetical protein F4805DRAFT_171229 [Annulohypoxylon moriforme]